MGLRDPIEKFKYVVIIRLIKNYQYKIANKNNLKQFNLITQKVTLNVMFIK